jgi:hypothetical protein
MTSASESTSGSPQRPSLRARSARPIVPLLLVALGACHGYRADLDDICNVSERSGLGPDAPFSQSAAWLAGHLRTAQARGLFEEMALSGGSAREFAARLRRESQAQGLVYCPLADRLVNLVDAASGPLPPTLFLVLTRDGVVFLDGASMPEDELAERLDKEVQRAPDLRCEISADPALPHGRVVRLLELIKAHRVKRVALNVAFDAGHP